MNCRHARTKQEVSSLNKEQLDKYQLGRDISKETFLSVLTSLWREKKEELKESLDFWDDPED